MEIEPGQESSGDIDPRERTVDTPYSGRVFQTRLRLHYTWFLAVVLITVAVVTQFSTAYSLWQRIVLGLAACLLFFLAVTIREFIINLIASRRGVPVVNVTLFVFGGLSRIEQEDNLPSVETLLAVVGMLSNLVIAAMFYLVYFILARTGNIIIDVLVQWLAFITFMLTLFHLLPGFPLDGGRLLRAVIWKATANYKRATLITSWCGWGIGLLCIGSGIAVMVMAQEWFVGALLVFPGLVLQNASTHSRRLVV
ncbi:MAG: site-2 protease family protein [Dehalococcoidales bacterium]|nr:MAG: site-2 protease family protein [Dehalococcoidales bacterium]